MTKIFCLLAAGTLSAAVRTTGPALVANDCNASNPAQKFDLAGANIVQRYSGLCFDIDGYRTNNQAPLQVYACHGGDHAKGHQNQGFAYNASSKEIVATSDAAGKRVDLANYGADGPGEVVWIYQRTGATNQQWRYDAATGLFTSMADATLGRPLCIDSSAPPPLPRACDVEPGKGQPWCDASLSREARVADLVARIQPSEVVGLFSNGAKGVKSLNIPPYQW